jgi:hypothetical protein
MKRIAVVIIIIVISVIFVIKSWTHEIDNYGTKEINLVNSAGKTVCMSCIGLSDEKVVTYIFDFFKPDNSKKEKK